MSQLELAFRSHGGARKRAGRKRRLEHDAPHRSRPAITGRDPLHVTCRTAPDVGRLRTHDSREAIRIALAKIAGTRHDFRVAQVSIQHNHLHMIVEADTQVALDSGMRALTISLARQINLAQHRTGKVFSYRYHTTLITSPRQMRNTLAYVLNNWRHHDEDKRGGRRARVARTDPYSSGMTFTGWRERREPFAPVTLAPLPVANARTWILNVGWMKHPLVSFYEIPADS
jgi:putative transposase